MPQPFAMRWAVRALAALCVVGALASSAKASELLMYRRDGCVWCAAWDREIGRRLPLRMVDLDRDVAPGVRMRSPVRFTPTFVLVDKGLEVGRIEGYPGDAFFWGLLEQLAKQLQSQPKKGAFIPDALLTASLELMP